MPRGIMRLNRIGRKKIGKKYYEVFKTTPPYTKEALEALRDEWREVKSPTKKGYEVTILVRGSRY